MISRIVGMMLKVAYLSMFANDYDPLDTILMILPVSLERWKPML